MQQRVILETVNDVGYRHRVVIEFLVTPKVSVETSAKVSAIIIAVLRSAEAPLVAELKE
jgi:hypothetical protein